MAKKRGLEYIARLSEATITLVLLMFIVFFAQALVVLVCLYVYEKPPPRTLCAGSCYKLDSQQWKIHSADKFFLPDGTVHLVRRIDTQDNGVYTEEEISDVNGSILWQGIRKDRPFKHLDWAEPPGWLDERDIGTMGVLEVPIRVGEKLEEVWQYNFKSDMFMGYKVEGGLIGYLGADGFAVSKTQTQPFGKFKGLTSWTDEDPSCIVMLVVTKRRIYQIDFRSRKVETVFDSKQSDIEFIQWHRWRPVNPKERIQYRPLIDCQTVDHKHHLIMREPNQILTMELPEQMQPKQMQTLRHWSSKVAFTATSDTLFLKYYEDRLNPPASLKLLREYQREYNSKPQPQSLQLYKVADSGKLELVNRFDWTKPVRNEPYQPYPPDRRETIIRWASTASPPVFNLLCELFGNSLYKLGCSEGIFMMQVYDFIITEFRPHYSSLNYVLSAAMMAFALWHGWPRRTSLSKLILWLIIVGAFNLAGLLTYLGLNHTPVIKCTACGKKRGLEKFNCIRCGSPLPAPQRRPTDLILAD
jgi:hypothetical protein